MYFFSDGLIPGNKTQFIQFPLKVAIEPSL